MEISHNAANLIWEAATAFEQEMMQHKAEGDQIAQRTVVVVKAGIITLSLVAILIFVAIVAFTSEMKAIVTSMKQMNQLFGCVSGSIDQMTLAVDNIEQDIQGIPVIASGISNIVDNIGRLRVSVHSITSDTTDIDHDIAITSSSVRRITDRMYHLTNTVHGMQRNLNQISQPIQSFNGWPLPFP